jgi:hypothetical protein
LGIASGRLVQQDLAQQEFWADRSCNVASAKRPVSSISLVRVVCYWTNVRVHIRGLSIVAHVMRERFPDEGGSKSSARHEGLRCRDLGLDTGIAP